MYLHLYICIYTYTYKCINVHTFVYKYIGEVEAFLSEDDKLDKFMSNYLNEKVLNVAIRNVLDIKQMSLDVITEILDTASSPNRSGRGSPETPGYRGPGSPGFDISVTPGPELAVVPEHKPLGPESPEASRRSSYATPAYDVHTSSRRGSSARLDCETDSPGSGSGKDSADSFDTLSPIMTAFGDARKSSKLKKDSVHEILFEVEVWMYTFIYVDIYIWT
jgi:hypothetical protein